MTRLLLLALLVSMFALHHARTARAYGEEGGVLYLDKYDFDLVVDGQRTVFVRFDQDYATGAAADEFKNLAKMFRALKAPPPYNFLLAAVKKGYGDDSNESLMERFGVSPTELPQFRLFVIRQNVKEPKKFEKGTNFTAATLGLFIKRYSGLDLGLPGCYKKLESLAYRFRSAKTPEEQLSVETETNKTIGGDAELASRKSAKYYGTVMHNVRVNGADWVSQEVTRTHKLLKSKIPNDKKEQMNKRLCVLYAFRDFKSSSADESSTSNGSKPGSKSAESKEP